MGYYDMTEGELKLAEIGREIAEYAENNKTKSLRFSRKLFEKDRKGCPEDDVWNNMLSACDKLTRFGTVWGPKSIDVFTEKEKCQTLTKFLKVMFVKWKNRTEN